MPKKNKKELAQKQEKFCRLYTTDPDCFGNGTATYLKVYSTKKKPIKYGTARTLASALLTNLDILTRINKYLEEVVMNDTTVDRQLGFLIEQHYDFPSKLGAIREYNKLKKRITEKFDVKFKETFELNDQQFEQLIKARARCLNGPKNGAGKVN